MSTLECFATALADRYRLGRELGAGGMATVYLAHDRKHDRDVAIKVLHPDLGAALGAERFLSEIKTTARLQHPHILPLLDSGAADGLLYYVMPFVRGETLRARLERERQLSIPDALRIAREVASALDHAHKQGIIHRDIKPENILLQDGAAVVADFGIALAVQCAGGQRMTQTGLSLGTPQYMSPEQAMGERAIDARSDIYALGAVTYEMLTGEPPFSGNSVQAIVARVLTERPTSLRTIRDTVSPSVEAAVLQALAKLPADRPENARQFADALALSAPITGTSTPPLAASDTANTATRRSAGRLFAFAGVLAGGLLLGWALRGSTSGQNASIGSELTRVQATFTGVAGLPALAPNGDVLAYVERRCAQSGHDAYAGWFATGVDAVPCRDRLMVQDTGTTTAVRVLDNVANIVDVRWTAAATALVFSGTIDTRSSGTYVLPRLGGTPRRVGNVGLLDVHAVADTAIVLGGSTQFGSDPWAMIIGLGDGRAVDSVRMPSPMLIGISWSPNGRWLAGTNARGRIYLINRETGKADSMAVSTRSRLRWIPDGSALVFYQPAAGRDDDFLHLSVTSNGHFSGQPSSIAPRSQMLYRGDFDVARRSGLVALITGSSLTDLHSFALVPGGTATSRQITSGTSWYGLPNVDADGREVFYLRGNGSGDNLFRVKLDTIEAQEEALSTGSGAGVSMFSPVSSDGRRLIFQREEASGIKTYEVNVQARTVTAIALAADGSWRPGLQPFGDRRVLGVSSDLRAILVATVGVNGVTRVPTPDDTRITAVALSPDATEVAVMAKAANETWFAITPLDRWAPRILQRRPGSPINTAITWRADGYLYFADWDVERRRPVLRRLSAAAGAPTTAQTVMALPERCNVRTVTVAAQEPIGVCNVDDFRGDVYLWRLNGVTK